MKTHARAVIIGGGAMGVQPGMLRDLFHISSALLIWPKYISMEQIYTRSWKRKPGRLQDGMDAEQYDWP